MIVEGFIEMIWAAVTMGVMKLYNLDASQGPTIMLAEIVGKVLSVFQAGDANSFFNRALNLAVILGVVALPITSGDTALRGCRLIVGEMLGIDQGKIKNRFLLSLAIFVLAAALLFVAKFSSSGFNVLWRYFAWANQTIVVFSLGTATAWCIKAGKKIWVTVLPGAFYLGVTSSFILNAKIGFNLSWTVSYSIAAVLVVAYISYFIFKKRQA